jgi:hypothetical protein
VTNLPWLVQASGPGPALQRARRTEQASRDLAALADRIRDHGLHLVVEDAVDIAFELSAQDLPPGTVDARGTDALGIALADPTAVLVTADGVFIGLRIGGDPRWEQLAALSRSRARLGTSALSGWYHGLVVDGPHAARFRNGVREQLVAVEAELVYGDGSVVRIERTTLAHIVRGSVRNIRCRSLVDAIRWTERPPVQATSAVYDAGELAALLGEADRLVPPVLVLNGEQWREVGTTEDDAL